MLSLPLLAAALIAPTLAAEGAVRLFEIPSASGGVVRGQADVPAMRPKGVVVMVAGTGTFDRDTIFGRTGGARDRIFKDLSVRLQRRGLAGVRYDKRGVIYAPPAAPKRDAAVSARVTVRTQLDDLRAVYDWARSPQGLGAGCVVILAHSEGMAHVGRLAASGAPAPAMVIGMGALAESPVGALRWQMAERDLESLRSMDADHDGVITNAEVKAHWHETPSGVLENPDPLLSPTGQWAPAELKQLAAKGEAFYEDEKRKALAVPDEAPWPDAAAPSASFQWWKSWFLDDAPAARNLSNWKTRFRFHYGSVDSQTSPARQVQAIRRYLPAAETIVEVHPGRGHGLGPHPLLGPIDEAIADEMAQQAETACASEGGGSFGVQGAR